MIGLMTMLQVRDDLLIFETISSPLKNTATRPPSRAPPLSPSSSLVCRFPRVAVGAARLLTGRTAATDDEVAGVPAEWRDLSPFPLRAMQARAFAAMATGADLVVNAATGSGKGMLLALPAAAALHASAPDVLAPVDIVIVPYKALGMHLEKVLNELFFVLGEEGRMRPGARALFVRRSRRADSAEEVDEPKKSTPAEEPMPKQTRGAEQVRRVVRRGSHFFPTPDPPPPPATPRRCRSPPAVGAMARPARRSDRHPRAEFSLMLTERDSTRACCLSRPPSASRAGSARCACTPTSSHRRPLRAHGAASTRAVWR